MAHRYEKTLLDFFKIHLMYNSNIQQSTHKFPDVRLQAGDHSTYKQLHVIRLTKIFFSGFRPRLLLRLHDMYEKEVSKLWSFVVWSLLFDDASVKLYLNHRVNWCHLKRCQFREISAAMDESCSRARCTYSSKRVKHSFIDYLLLHGVLASVCYMQPAKA